MKNLILNPRRIPDRNNAPKYFTSSGINFDHCWINGFRTCSLTREDTDKEDPFEAYSQAIPVQGQRAIKWGYHIRAVEAQNVILTARFYDETGVLLHTLQQPIANWLTPEWQWRLARFPIPPGAQTARLSIEFSGKITACTFYGPTAFYCK